jgi:hypothetical protein
VPVADEIARALRALDVEDLGYHALVDQAPTILALYRAREERVSLTLEYVTDPAMSPLKRFVSNMKDAIAYFGFRAVIRGRVRASPSRSRGPGTVGSSRRIAFVD